MTIDYSEYPTPETQLVAHMLDFSLHQAFLALKDQALVACAVQLSAAAAYAGVLSVLLPGHTLGLKNQVLMFNLTESLVQCTTAASQHITSN